MKYVEMGFGVSVLPDIMMSTKDKIRMHLRPLDDVEAGSGLSQYGVLLKRGKYIAPAARELIKFLCPDFDFGVLGEGRAMSPLPDPK